MPDVADHPAPPATAARNRDAHAPRGTTDTAGSPPRRHRLRKWGVRAAIALLALIVVLVVVVQMVLWTDYPRKVALAQVQKSLGLRVTAAKLSVSWFGHTTLRDVTIALPLADESFFAVPTLSVEHTSLPWLAITQSIAIEEILLDAPKLVVRQDQAGRWNLEDVALLLARAGGSKTPEQRAQRSPATPALPAVRIADGTILIDRGDRQATIAPLVLEGRPVNPLVYQYNLKAGDQLTAEGRVAPAEGFKHEVKFSVQQLAAVAQAFVPDFPNDVRAQGTWDGQIINGQLAGRLTLGEAHYGVYTAKGVLTAEQVPGGVNVRPQELIVTGAPGTGDVRIVGGTIAYAKGLVTTDRLLVDLAGGRVLVDSKYDPATRAGDAVARWTDLAIADISQAGQATLSVREPFPNQPRIEARIESTGSGPSTAWDAALKLTAEGDSYAAYPDIQFQAERLSGHYGSRRFDLGGLTANLALADDALSLRSITGGDSGAGPVLSGFGQYRLGDKFYYLWLEGRGPQLPGGSDEPLVFMIDVWGNGDRDPSKLSDAAGTLNLLYLRDSRVELTGTGVYDARLPKPCALNVSISKIPAHAAPGEDPPLVAGDLSGDAYLAGTVRPMDMEIQFWLNGRDLAVGKRMIGDVKVELTGSARPDGTVSLQGKELELLEGTWRITALSRRPFEKAKVNISFTDLPAAELAQVAGSVDAPLDGTFRGAWAIDVDTTRGNAVTVGGVVEGSDLAAGPIKAATMSARTTLRQGRIALDPVLFRQGDGEARFAITTTTDAPQQVRLTLAAREWPVELTDGLALTATSDAAFDVDLKALGATGTVTTRVAAKLGDKDAGDARVRVTTRGRVIRVESLAAEVVGGTVEGNTTIDLTRPLEAIGRFSFANLSGERMVELVPAAKGLTGTYHGTLAFSPATGERPLGPLEGRLTLTPTPDAAFRGMRLGDSRVQGYLGSRVPADRATLRDINRIVADDVKLSFAGGTVDSWVRLSRHGDKDAGGVFTTLATVQLYDLQLNEVLGAVAPNLGDYPGLVGGRFTLNADPTDPRGVFGRGALKVTKSDLGNFGPIAALYDLMRLGTAPKEPTGEGSLDLTFERGTATINNMKYFNRGAEVRVYMAVDNVYDGKESAISGDAVGSIRPLRDINLPLFAEADDVLAALQSNLTSVRIGGTLGSPTAVPQALAEAGSSLRSILVGEAKTTAND